MPAAGALRDRYTFQRRLGSAVVNGLDKPGGWGGAAPDAYTCWAQTQYLRGTEAVQAARLQGDQPVVLTIRRSTASNRIDNAWRAVDARDATRVFDVTSVAPNKLDPLGFLDVLAVQRRGQTDGG